MIEILVQRSGRAEPSRAVTRGPGRTLRRAAAILGAVLVLCSASSEAADQEVPKADAASASEVSVSEVSASEVAASEAAPETDASLPTAPSGDLCATLRGGAETETEERLAAFEGLLEKHPDDLRCGSDYRRFIIASEAYDRGVAFFEGLVAAHPEASNAYLNLGYALVDKIPAEGAITQVLMANTALGHFSKALELEESWVGYYTRGNSYLFWPAIFGRTPLGIADLEKAVELSNGKEKRDHHARAWSALGDGHWRLDDLAKARETWKKGLELYPDNPHLTARISKNDEELATFLDSHFDTNNRVDTDLAVLWEGGF